MKILVDKMPETPKDCPYCIIRDDRGWYGCDLRSISCVDTKSCPVFAQTVEVKQDE